MTASETTGPAPLRMTLFGPIQVFVEGRPLPRMRSRKGLWLLALLTLRHDRPVEREWLTGTLWPDTDQSQAFANLRPILSELRRGLGSQSRRLQSPDRHTLLLNLMGADVDLLAFDAAIASNDISNLERAVALYSGPLLEGCAEEWVFQDRNVRHHDCLQALQQLGDFALAAGDYAKAVSSYQRAVNLDPWWETARRGWMEALAKSGDRNAALHVYREFVELLRNDLNASPDEQTSALYVRLRAEARQQGNAQAVVRTQTAVVGPRPAAAPAVSGYLPHPLTDLIGREAERGEVASRLQRSRLITLTGPGGIGKTRLALEVAKAVVHEYADGVWLVGLDALTAGKLVLSQIASVLGVREEAGRPLLRSVIEHLRRKRLLLVLDNCEHVLEAGAQVAGHLLQECEGVQILATSREALGITGETAWAVPTLPVPDPVSLPREPIPLLQSAIDYESIQLFVERAQAVQKSFSLTGNNALAVAEVCAQLDGIPLAIELAAARVKIMPLEQIVSRLHADLGLLTGGNRTALSRQRTLRATLDWSYALLTEQERRLLVRLAVFAGGWTLEAAEAICSAEGVQVFGYSGIQEQAEPQSRIPNTRTPERPNTESVLDLLTSLVDKSLVAFEERQGEGSGRYRLLEMVRQYAAEGLAASEEAERVRARHRDYFLALAEEAEPHLSGAEQGRWLARLETEHENLRAALDWCRAEDTGTEAGIRLAGALWRFWEVHGHYSEGRAYLQDAIERAEAGEQTTVLARALNGAGVLAFYQGDYTAARALHEESLAINRSLGDKEGIAWPLHHLGLMAARQGDYTAARALHEESLAIWRDLGARQGIAWTLHQLASVAREQGEFETARALSAESLTIWRELGNKQGIAWSLNDLGNVIGLQGDYPAAGAMYAESLAISRELGDRQGIAWSLHHLGNVTGLQGDYAAASALYEESLTIFRELGDKQGLAWTLHHLGDSVGLRGDRETAGALQKESLALQWELGNKLGIARSLNSLGRIAYTEGDVAGARALYEESLSLHRELADRRGVADSLEGLAALMLAQPEAQKAVRLWGAAQALRETIGAPRSVHERETVDVLVEQARDQLGDTVFAAIWEEGRNLAWDEATYL